MRAGCGTTPREGGEQDAEATVGDIVLELARSPMISFGSNHPEFPDGCVAVEGALVAGSYPKNSDNCHHVNIPTTRATPPPRLGARRTGRPKRLNAVEPFAGLVAAVPTLSGLVTAPCTRARQPLSVLRAPRARASLPGPRQARRAARGAEPRARLAHKRVDGRDRRERRQPPRTGSRASRRFWAQR